jgi:hypothetical protein
LLLSASRDDSFPDTAPAGAGYDPVAPARSRNDGFSWVLLGVYAKMTPLGKKIFAEKRRRNFFARR